MKSALPSLLLFLALAAPAQAQAIGQAGDSGVSLWRVLLALLLCLGLGAAAVLVLRRHAGRGLPFAALAGGVPERRIRVVEQHYLGPQRSICLIEIDGRSYVALIAGQAASVMALRDEEGGKGQ